MLFLGDPMLMQKPLIESGTGASVMKWTILDIKNRRDAVVVVFPALER